MHNNITPKSASHPALESVSDITNHYVPTIVRSDPLAGLRPYIEYLWINKTAMCRDMYTDSFPTGTAARKVTKQDEDKFLLTHFTSIEMREQGPRFLKQALYSIARWNDEQLIQFVSCWITENVSMFQDPSMVDQMCGPPLPTPRTFFTTDDTNKVGDDSFLLERAVVILQRVARGVKGGAILLSVDASQDKPDMNTSAGASQGVSRSPTSSVNHAQDKSENKGIGISTSTEEAISPLATRSSEHRKSSEATARSSSRHGNQDGEQLADRARGASSFNVEARAGDTHGQNNPPVLTSRSVQSTQPSSQHSHLPTAVKEHKSDMRSVRASPHAQQYASFGMPSPMSATPAHLVMSTPHSMGTILEDGIFYQPSPSMQRGMVSQDTGGRGRGSGGSRYARYSYSMDPESFARLPAERAPNVQETNGPYQNPHGTYRRSNGRGRDIAGFQGNPQRYFSEQYNGFKGPGPEETAMIRPVDSGPGNHEMRSMQVPQPSCGSHIPEELICSSSMIGAARIDVNALVLLGIPVNLDDVAVRRFLESNLLGIWYEFARPSPPRTVAFISFNSTHDTRRALYVLQGYPYDPFGSGRLQVEVNRRFWNVIEEPPVVPMPGGHRQGFNNNSRGMYASPNSQAIRSPRTRFVTDPLPGRTRRSSTLTEARPASDAGLQSTPMLALQNRAESAQAAAPPGPVAKDDVSSQRSTLNPSDGSRNDATVSWAMPPKAAAELRTQDVRSKKPKRKSADDDNMKCGSGTPEPRTGGSLSLHARSTSRSEPCESNGFQEDGASNDFKSPAGGQACADIKLEERDQTTSLSAADPDASAMYETQTHVFNATDRSARDDQTAAARDRESLNTKLSSEKGEDQQLLRDKSRSMESYATPKAKGKHEQQPSSSPNLDAKLDPASGDDQNEGHVLEHPPANSKSKADSPTYDGADRPPRERSVKSRLSSAVSPSPKAAEDPDDSFQTANETPGSDRSRTLVETASPTMTISEDRDPRMNDNRSSGTNGHASPPTSHDDVMVSNGHTSPPDSGHIPSQDAKDAPGSHQADTTVDPAPSTSDSKATDAQSVVSKKLELPKQGPKQTVSLSPFARQPVSKKAKKPKAEKSKSRSSSYAKAEKSEKVTEVARLTDSETSVASDERGGIQVWPHQLFTVSLPSTASLTSGRSKTSLEPSVYTSSNAINPLSSDRKSEPERAVTSAPGLAVSDYDLEASRKDVRPGTFCKKVDAVHGLDGAAPEEEPAADDQTANVSPIFSGNADDTQTPSEASSSEPNPQPHDQQSGSVGVLYPLDTTSSQPDSRTAVRKDLPDGKQNNKGKGRAIDLDHHEDDDVFQTPSTEPDRLSIISPSVIEAGGFTSAESSPASSKTVRPAHDTPVSTKHTPATKVGRSRIKKPRVRSQASLTPTKVESKKAESKDKEEDQVSTDVSSSSNQSGSSSIMDHFWLAVLATPKQRIFYVKTDTPARQEKNTEALAVGSSVDEVEISKAKFQELEHQEKMVKLAKEGDNVAMERERARYKTLEKANANKRLE